ncbi:MAG: hypothetical protein IPP66_11715 [Anaerolineales bacterium]|nr:hypothetical protein [Anaerolineales bacterium]
MDVVIQLLSPLAVPAIALIIGWVLGYFDSNKRTADKIKKAEETAKFAVESAEARLAQVTSKAAESPTLPYAVDDPGLMRIKNENGILTLDLDGERMIPNALTAEQRKRLIEMLNAIRPWLEGKPAIAPATMPASPLPPMPTTPIGSIAIRPAPTPPAFPPSQVSSLETGTSSAKTSSKKKVEEPELPPHKHRGTDQLHSARTDHQHPACIARCLIVGICFRWCERICWGKSL